MCDAQLTNVTKSDIKHKSKDMSKRVNDYILEMKQRLLNISNIIFNNFYFWT